MNKLTSILFISIIIINSYIGIAHGQNVAITDDNTYVADPSAMLDVKSLTKGMLA